MRIKDRRWQWGLGLALVMLLPVGMTIAVVNAFAKPKSAPPEPRVVAAWPAGPMEVHVAFDRAVDPVVATQAVSRVIRFDPGHPSPGAGRPGGEGGSIRIAAAKLIDEGRTLVLHTDPHPSDATYSVMLDSIKSPGEPGNGRARAIEYTLHGVEVTWTPEGKTEPIWSGWWPVVDPATACTLLAGSGEHDRLWPLLHQAGKLALRSFVTLPPARLTMAVTGVTPFEVALGVDSASSSPDHRVTLPVETTAEPMELTATIATLAGGPEPTLGWALLPADPKLGGGPTLLPPNALGLAWAPPSVPESAAPVIPPHLATGGDPRRGAIVFAGEQAKCANCHQVRGSGGQVGPDLSSLAGASRGWVYQNIIEPSAAIHPDYLSYTVALKDGRVSMGIVRAVGADALRVGDIDAKFTTFARDEIEDLRPSRSSIMPVGLLGALGDEQTRDLLAFLTSQEPAVAQPSNPPAPADVAAPR